MITPYRRGIGRLTVVTVAATAAKAKAIARAVSTIRGTIRRSRFRPLRIYLVTLMKASMASTSPLTDVRATATGCAPRAPSMQRVFKANRQNQLNSVLDDEWVGIGDRDDDASGAAISSAGRMRCAGLASKATPGPRCSAFMNLIALDRKDLC